MGTRSFTPEGLQRWLRCEDCALGARANRHVLGRGSLPADILFVGEGPGRSEDVLGEAFVGPAGKLLDRAIPEEYADRSLYFTNLVACRPTDGTGQPNRPPLPAEIAACAPRLLKTLELSQCKGVVLCGRLAGEVWRTISLSQPGKRALFIFHPAALLRRGGDQAADWASYRNQILNFFLEVLG